jgi:hypothetical protein
MRVEVERHSHAPFPWTRVRVFEGNDNVSTRDSLLESVGGSFLVSYYTPSGRFYKEKFFDDHETAWRFMWRTAMGMGG